MGIHFPAYEDIRLKNAPLTEVICQVKFPSILRIVNDAPSGFQDQIRKWFPLYSQEQGLVLRTPKEKGSDFAVMEVTNQVHRFKTANEKTGVGLSSDFFALSTTEYTHWDEFLENVRLVLSATTSEYQPIYATRVGLRMINRFTKENSVAGNSAELLSIFKDQLTCTIQTDAWHDPIEMNQAIVLAEGTMKLAIRTRYASENGEDSFVLDLDAFEEGEIPLDGFLDKLDQLHNLQYAGFRWSINEKDLQRFQPMRSGDKGQNGSDIH